MTATGRLAGKTAIITGGARAIGGATSRAFAAQGAQIMITDVLVDEGSKLAAEIGPAARFMRHDVSQEADWKAVGEAAMAAWGHIDILINNAGILMFKSIPDTTAEDFKRILEVNLVGCFLGIRTISPYMIAQGKGAIVNTSSIDGMKGANSLAAYGASKWGVRGLTKVAALELGYKGIRVNSVHPGGINTPMGNPGQRPVEEANQSYGTVPMQRIGSPEEVAGAMVYLASDESSYTTGAEITVDGGWMSGQYYMGFPGSPGH